MFLPFSCFDSPENYLENWLKKIITLQSQNNIQKQTSNRSVESITSSCFVQKEL